MANRYEPCTKGGQSSSVKLIRGVSCAGPLVVAVGNWKFACSVSTTSTPVHSAFRMENCFVQTRGTNYAAIRIYAHKVEDIKPLQQTSVGRTYGSCSSDMAHSIRPRRIHYFFSAGGTIKNIDAGLYLCSPRERGLAGFIKA